MRVQLFTAQAADGDSSAVDLRPGSVPGIAFYGTLFVDGTFGGGTVTVLVSPDDGTTWVTTDVTFTEENVQNLQINAPVKLKLSLSGATTPSISAWIASA